jgi:hypothetical protein
MDPAGTRGLEAARRPQGRAVPLVVSLMVSLVVSLRVGSGEGDRARPDFSGRSGVPSGGRMDPGNGPRRDPGSGGGAAASGPSSAISGITKGGGGGKRSGAPGFLRAAPWEGASPGPGSRRQPQNPVSLDLTRAFLGIPQQIRDRLCDFPDCKVREHAAGRPGLNRGFPGSRRRAGDGKRRRGGEAGGRRPRALHASRKRRERPT